MCRPSRGSSVVGANPAHTSLGFAVFADPQNVTNADPSLAMRSRDDKHNNTPPGSAAPREFGCATRVCLRHASLPAPQMPEVDRLFQRPHSSRKRLGPPAISHYRGMTFNFRIRDRGLFLVQAGKKRRKRARGIQCFSVTILSSDVAPFFVGLGFVESNCRGLIPEFSVGRSVSR